VKLRVYTADGGRVEIKQFDSDSWFDLQEDLLHGDEAYLHFQLDAKAEVYVARSQIVRVDLDHGDQP
jgi:hypothetical protein